MEHHNPFASLGEDASDAPADGGRVHSRAGGGAQGSREGADEPDVAMDIGGAQGSRDGADEPDDAMDIVRSTT